MADPIIQKTGGTSPPSSPGRGANDLVAGEIVVLADTEPLNIGASYLWEFEDVPLGTTPVLINPTTATPSFTVDANPSLAGSHRVKCTVDGVSSSIEIFGKPLTFTGSRIPGFQEREDYDEAGNPRGWQKAETDFKRSVDAALASHFGDGSGSLYLAEQAAPSAFVSGIGQFWVEDNSPNTARFTDDTGVTFHLVATLQRAYDVNRNIVTDVGAVAISGSDDANNILTVDKSPASSNAGHGIDVIMGANATGVGVNISHSGSGNALNAAGGMGFDLDSTLSFMIDGRTNPRLITTGAVRQNHTAGIAGTRAFHLDIISAGFDDTKGLVVKHDLAGSSAIINPQSLNLDADITGATNAHLDFLKVSKVGDLGAGMQLHALNVHEDIHPVHQHSGALVSIEKAWAYDDSLASFADVTAAFASTGTDVQLFVEDSDIVYIGNDTTFSRVAVELAIAASNPGVKPVFEYSKGASVWSSIATADNTNGFRENGNLMFTVPGDWATDSVNGTTKFWVRITRTASASITPPTEDLVRYSDPRNYLWNKDGDLDIRGLELFEQATVPGGAPATAKGKVWLRDDNVLIFTNESAVDTQLGTGAQTLSVTNIADPSTELNAIQGAVKGDLRLLYQTDADADIWSLYAWDDADSSGEEVPYRVDGSTGMWSAFAGRYNWNGIDTPGEMVLFAGSAKEISIGESVLENTSTGVHRFDGLSIGAPTTDINIGAGAGHILNIHTAPDSPTHTDVVWTATSLTIADRSDETITWIYMDSAGVPQQQTTMPTAIQLRENLHLGFLITVSDAILAFVSNPYVNTNPAMQLSELFDAVGTINLSVSISNGGSNLKLANSGGILVARGANFDGTEAGRAAPNDVAIASANPQQFRKGTQTSFDPAFVTDVDPANYDLAGVVTAIGGSNNQATNQRIFVAPDGSWAVSYGTVIYPTISAAISGVASEAFIDHPTIAVNKAVLVATMSITKGATDLSNDTHVRFLSASRFGESSIGGAGQSVTSIQQAYNNSLDGTITTDATRTALKVVNTLSDVTNTLELTKSPGASFAGDALLITLGANATGRGLNIINGGSGLAIEVSSGHIQTGLGQRFIFDDDADTYVNAASDDIVTFTAGTVDVFRYNTSQLRMVLTGSEAAPALIPGRNDPDTGFWSPADDTTALSTGALEAVRWTSSQNQVNAGWISIDSGGASDPQLMANTVDPSAAAGISAPEGSLLMRFVATAGEVWFKDGAADTAWTQVGAGGGGTLDTAYDFGGPGAGRAIIADSGSVTVTTDSIGTAETAGFELINSTDAAVGAQQFGPMFVQQGEGWKTDATASTQTIKFAQQVQPIQGANNPTGELVFKASIENISAGAYVDMAKLNTSGQWLMNDGVASMPVFAAASNPDLGIYFGADDVRISINSNLRGVWQSAGLLIGTSGTESAPALQIPNSSSGIFSPGTDQLAISTSLTEAVRWNSSQQMLTVDGSTAAPAHSFASNVGTGMSAGVNTLSFSTDGAIASNISSSNFTIYRTLRPDGNFSRANGSASRHWTNVFARVHLSRFDAVGVDEDVGMSLTNATAATAGLTQNSPMTVYEGQGWKTDATAATQEVLFAMQLEPIQGAANPTGDLVFKSNINGAGYSDVARLSSTGQWLMPDGSTGSPAYTFASENTGFFLDATNRVGLSMSGIERYNFLNTAFRCLFGGTETLPAISLSGDVDTGEWHPAADTWAISTAGIEAMRLDVSQNMLVAGNVQLGIGQRVVLDDDLDTFIQADADDRIKFYAGSASANRASMTASAWTTFIANNVQISAIGTAETTGQIIINASAAAAGAQQYSPMTVWRGQGWRTDATAESQIVLFATQLETVQGAANPSGNFVLKSNVDGAGYIERQRWTSNPTGEPVSTITRDAVGVSDASEMAGLRLENTTDAALDTQQFSPLFELQGEGWDTSVNATKPVAHALQVVPVQGESSAPDSDLVFKSSLDGGVYTDIAKLGNVGQLSILGIFKPFVTDVQDIGSNSLRWGTVWALKFNAEQSLQTAQIADATGSPPIALSIVSGAHTSINNTEAHQVNLDISNTLTFDGGATSIPNQRSIMIDVPTYDAAVAGFVITDAATMYIGGAPIAGSANITLTNPEALLIESGDIRLASGNLKISTNNQLSFDDDQDSYIISPVDDSIQIFVGGFQNSVFTEATITFVQPVTIQESVIGETVVFGEALLNSSDAAAGAQQWSPALEFEGQGWKTNATAETQRVKFTMQLEPVQGAANPSGELVWKSNVNEAGYVDRAKLTTAGELSIGGDFLPFTDSSKAIGSTGVRWANIWADDLVLTNDIDAGGGMRRTLQILSSADLAQGTEVELTSDGTTGGDVGLTYVFVAPRAGSVVELAVWPGIDVASGQCDFWIQSSTDGGDTWGDLWGSSGSPVLSLTGEATSTTQEKDADAFVVGEMIRIKAVADGSWPVAPGVDVYAQLTVEC